MQISSQQIMTAVLLLNTVIAVGYCLVMVVIRPLCLKKQNLPVKKYFIISVVMLLCPVVGALYFLLGSMFQKVFFRAQVDISEVIFSKERSRIIEKADREREMNMAPLEEAIAVSDTTSLRTLMLNVIKGEINDSLASISLALNSSDSETSHYAASVLRDQLNDFRAHTQQVYQKILEDPDDSEEYCGLLLSYMNSVLSQKIFAEIEQSSFVHLMEKVAEILFQKQETDGKLIYNEEIMPGNYYEWMALRLLEINDYEMCEKWSKRAVEAFPYELFPYKCELKLYFTTFNKEKFFAVMEELKSSNIIIDRETIELVRVFS